MATGINTLNDLQARVAIVDPKTGLPTKDFLQKINEAIKAINDLREFVDTQHP